MTLNRILLALAVVSCPLASAQPAQNAAGTHTGCLLLKDGRYILQDNETQEIVELNGPDLDLNVGNHVRVLGRVSPAKAAIPVATKVIDVN